jgi:hypothetical protein
LVETCVNVGKRPAAVDAGQDVRILLARLHSVERHCHGNRPGPVTVTMPDLSMLDVVLPPKCFGRD